MKNEDDPKKKKKKKNKNVKNEKNSAFIKMINP